MATGDIENQQAAWSHGLPLEGGIEVVAPVVEGAVGIGVGGGVAEATALEVEGEGVAGREGKVEKGAEVEVGDAVVVHREVAPHGILVGHGLATDDFVAAALLVVDAAPEAKVGEVFDGLPFPANPGVPSGHVESADGKGVEGGEDAAVGDIFVGGREQKAGALA